MFTKTSIALALVAAMTTAAAAAPKQHSTNPSFDVFVNGKYVGSDPDPRIRWTLRDEARRSYGLSD